MTARTAAAGLLCAALAACGGAAREPARASRPSNAAPELVFAWKLPSVAQVVQKRQRDRNQVEIRFVICARAIGGGLVEVREIDHRVVGAPPSPDVERPALLIAADGTVYDVVGIERALEQVMQSAGDAGIAKQRMTSPAVLAQLKEKYAETWHLWVDTWLNFDPRRAKQTVSTTIPLGAVELEVPQEFEYLGWTGGDPRLVKMRMRAVLAGPEASRALASFMQELVDVPEPMKGQVDQLELQRSVEVEIETEPRTLMPRRVTSRTVIRVTIGTHPPRERSQSDDYRFDWSPPADAAKSCERTWKSAR